MEKKHMEEFDWINLNTEMDKMSPETSGNKFIRKMKENPLVPIGCLATTLALSYGLWSFRTGNKKMSQYMMRTRVAAQGFTIFALIAGLALSTTKIK